MRLVITHCIAWGVAGLVLANGTPALAGPSTAEMAVAEPPVAVVSATGTSVDGDRYDSGGLGSGSAKDLFSTADDLSPRDSHPMIPLPPAVWAGFVGLAFVARRVLRQSNPKRR